MYKYILLGFLLVPPSLCMKRVPNWTEKKFQAARDFCKADRQQILRDSIAALKKQCELNKKIVKKDK